MADLATLRRWFEGARAEVHRLEAVKPKGAWGRAVLERQLRAARSALAQRRRELEAAEAAGGARG